jgi:hypothetical protein
MILRIRKIPHCRPKTCRLLPTIRRCHRTIHRPRRRRIPLRRARRRRRLNRRLHPCRTRLRWFPCRRPLLVRPHRRWPRRHRCQLPSVGSRYLRPWSCCSPSPRGRRSIRRCRHRRSNNPQPTLRKRTTEAGVIGTPIRENGGSRCRMNETKVEASTLAAQSSPALYVHHMRLRYTQWAVGWELPPF